MAIATAAAITSMAATAASTGMSISQASKARKSQREAEREAERITEETKRMMDFNPFEAVAIQKEPYEIMAESIVEGAAREAELLAEADPRYLAGMAGARGQQQQDQLEKVRAAMSRELQGLEITTAQEEANIRNNLLDFAEAEITGAQQAAAEQGMIANQATVGAIQGFGSLAGQAAELVPLYSKGGAKKQLKQLQGGISSATPFMMTEDQLDLLNNIPVAFNPAFAGLKSFSAPSRTPAQDGLITDLGGLKTVRGLINEASGLKTAKELREFRRSLSSRDINYDDFASLMKTFNK